MVSGDQGAPYIVAPITAVEKLTEINKVEVFYEEDCLAAVKSLASNPSQVVVNQINGSVPIEAWDILPLSLSEVATATQDIWLSAQSSRGRPP